MDINIKNLPFAKKKMDPQKISSLVFGHIRPPTAITKAWSFMGFALFYQRFIHNFEGLTALIKDCLHKGKFH